MMQKYQLYNELKVSTFVMNDERHWKPTKKRLARRFWSYTFIDYNVKILKFGESVGLERKREEEVEVEVEGNQGNRWIKKRELKSGIRRSFQIWLASKVGAVNGKESRETWVFFWKIYSESFLQFALHAANGKWEFSFYVEPCTLLPCWTDQLFQTSSVLRQLMKEAISAFK